LDAGQEAKAKQLFEVLAESPNRRMQAYFYLGLLEARKNHMEEALQWFDKVTEGPGVFDAQVNAVSTLITMGRIPEARQRLDGIRKQHPQEALRLYLLEGELLTKGKNYTEAFALLSKALEEMPGQTELLYSRALVAEELGRVDVLEADLRAVLEKKPDDANALNALGFSLADRSERLEEAKRYIAKALELKPNDPAILDSYGWVSYRLGDNETALEYLGRAYSLFKDPEIGAHYGEVLWESGKQQEAKKIWQELARKSPDHKNVKSVMARYPEAFAK
jgi:tetratricopeptide (TPR) repeat protein